MASGDGLRLRVKKAELYYELAHDASNAYLWELILAMAPRPKKEDAQMDDSEDFPTFSPYRMLEYAIDIKYLVMGFLDELEANHGSKRREDMAEWIQDGWTKHKLILSHAKRKELRADIRRLRRIINKYKSE